MKKILVISALLIGAIAVRADESAFQASLTPGVAYKSKDTVITGFAINIWGENPQHSFNLGIVNGSTGESSGFSLGIVNYAESYSGVQWGLVNYTSDTFVGFQHGFVNANKETKGLQMGFFNYTEKMDGVQIGLINIIKDNGWFDEFPSKLAKGFPIVNWSF